MLGQFRALKVEPDLRAGYGRTRHQSTCPEVRFHHMDHTGSSGTVLCAPSSVLSSGAGGTEIIRAIAEAVGAVREWQRRASRKGRDGRRG